MPYEQKKVDCREKFFPRLRLLAGKFRRLLQKIISLHHNLIFVKDLPEAVAWLDCKVPAEFIQLEASDIARLEQAMKQAREFHPGMIEQRFKDKEVAWAVIIEGRIVHYDFVTFQCRWLDIVQQEFRLKQNEAFIYNCHTLEAWRGKGLFTCALNRLNHHLASSGTKRCFIDADAGNEASLKAIRKAGFEHYQSRYMLRILGRPALRKIFRKI